MNIDVNTTFLLWISRFFLRLLTVLTTNIRRTIYSGNRNVNLLPHCYYELETTKETESADKAVLN